MAGKLENVVYTSLKTFKNVGRSGAQVVEDTNINKLVNLVNELRFTDLKIPARLLNESKDTLHSRDPVAHFTVYEDRDVTVGVFILKEGAKIPLHDHPGMHGLLRVLLGRVRITSYNIIEFPADNISTSSLFYSKPFKTLKNPPVSLGSDDGCSVLTPMRNNIHEVVCLSGPAAFLDVLSPPYSDDCLSSSERSCHYFKEVKEDISDVIKLIEIPCPGNFWINGEPST